MIITIDGHAGSGKSTAARQLAAELRFELLNTGAMYRAVAFALARRDIDIYADRRDEAAITRLVESFHFDLTDTRVRVNGEDVTDHVYTEEMGRGASKVGTFPEVRAKLKREQRRIAAGRDVICEGRDQGTAVFPDAPLKFFFTASAEVRARRRAEQDGIDPARQPDHFARLLQQIIDRDRQDEERAIDPLKRAADAILIDTSHHTLDETLATMLEAVDRHRTRRG